MLPVQFPSSYVCRDDEVSELVLNMADVSTNLVMLTGRHGIRAACCQYYWEQLQAP